LVVETIRIDRYGVMGYPVSHSRSPAIHRVFAMQTGERIQYELLQVAPDKLESAIRQFQNTGGKGLNITVPHKTKVIRYVDQMSERATTVGAVNTLVFRDDGIFGDNTDGIGLLRDLVVNLGLSIEDFGRLALKSQNPPRIAGRCSVFAKSDMIHLQQIATPDYDIVSGLCYAVARNFKSAIARGKKFVKPVSFQGGVAANAGMIRAFEDILDLEPVV